MAKAKINDIYGMFKILLGGRKYFLRWWLPWCFLNQRRWPVLNRDIIELEIIEFCNLKCLNCECSFEHAPSSELMTAQQIKKFVDESINLHWRWKMIKLRGGEPTLHPEILRIIEILKLYRDFNPDCEFAILTNNFSDYTKRILSKMPQWIQVISSEKRIQGGRIIGNTSHDSINKAPVDLLIYKFADFTKGCYRPIKCGMQLSRYGYYPCAMGAHISRIFGFDIALKSISLVKEDAFTRILSIICKYCGHYKQPEEAAVTSAISGSWKKAFRQYNKEKPKITLY